jgi:hypothetical protein
VEDTWFGRERPVLDAAITLLDQDSSVRARDIVAATGFDLETVAQALDALHGEYIVDLVKPAGGAPTWRFTRVTADARRAVGQWQTAESLVGRLAEAFSEAADQEADPERKSRLRQIASFLGEAGKDVAAEIIAKIFMHQVGMG